MFIDEINRYSYALEIKLSFGGDSMVTCKESRNDALFLKDKIYAILGPSNKISFFPLCNNSENLKAHAAGTFIDKGCPDKLLSYLTSYFHS